MDDKTYYLYDSSNIPSATNEDRCILLYSGVVGYVGSIEDGKLHGTGIAYLINGDKYEGKFWYGEMNGKGTRYYKNDGIRNEEYYFGRLMGSTFISKDFYCINEHDENGKIIDVTISCDPIIKIDNIEYQVLINNEQKPYITMNDKTYYLYHSSNIPYKTHEENCVILSRGVVEYVGSMKDGKRNGTGIAYLTNGDKYEGEWKGGKQNGNGVYTCRNGVVYKGVFLDGLLNGPVTKYDKPTNTTYYGNYENGKSKEDFIHIFTPYKREYKGLCDDMKKPNGKGIEVYYKRGYYCGEFKCGKRHGYGFRNLADQFPTIENKSGLPQVEDKKLSEITTECYEGEWKDDQRHGIGIYKFPDGSVYEGEWERNQPHGIGKLTYPDGSIYEGCYKHGKKDGIFFVIKGNNISEREYSLDKRIIRSELKMPTENNLNTVTNQGKDLGGLNQP
jgi:hypothetical protein